MTGPGAAPILVTGGSGLLGRAVLAQMAGSRPAHALVRTPPPRPLPEGAQPVIHDLRDPADIALPTPPETILHLAQSARYREFPEGALDVFEVNVGATQRLLDWGRRQGTKRFVYASTGGVYGAGERPFTEDDPAGRAASLDHYIASKRAGELVAEAYRDEMIVIVLRFFFVYGPGQRRTMLIPRLLDSVVAGRPVRLDGEEGIRLNPVYVDDAAAAIEAALSLPESETINVAGPEVLSLREITTAIGETTGHEPRFETVPDSSSRHLVGDTAKMARLLTPPRVGFADGVSRLSADRATTEGRRHAG